MNFSDHWSLAGKRLILTVTPGRSGTGYLTNLLVGLPGIDAVHEPPPKFSDVMRAVQHDHKTATTFWIEKKLPAIRESDEQTYVETSHLACKGFMEPLLEHDIVPDLIILQRDPISVATSLYMLDTIPARTIMGEKFLLRPNDPTVVPLKRWQELHDWALCYWYCREIERRMRLYARAVAQHGGQLTFTSIERLKTQSGIIELLNFLNLNNTRGTAEQIAAKQNDIINAKSESKIGKPYIGADLMHQLADEVDLRLSGNT